jgi:hypothetical protein
MFLRVVRAAGGQGVKHEYVRVVEAVRQNGKTRHRTILNLGRRDVLAEHLDLTKLMRLLHGDASTPDRPARTIQPDDVAALAAWDWGPALAARHLWSELGLEAMAMRSVTVPSCWCSIALLRPAANIGWHGGWRATSSVIVMAGDG